MYGVKLTAASISQVGDGMVRMRNQPDGPDQVYKVEIGKRVSNGCLKTYCTGAKYDMAGETLPFHSATSTA
jgi:hypothetical protein